MRVISGKYKSIKLNSLAGMTTRPTTDKVKESIFNMISCDNDNILDLFSGSGALGIEALSRGAKYVVFIDGSSAAIKVIRNNLKKCNIEDKKYSLYRNDFLRSIKIFSKKSEKFDFIFLDPPYNKNLLNISLENLIKYDICNENCKIICEYSSDEKINYKNEKLHIYKEKKYGKITVSIYVYRR